MVKDSVTGTPFDRTSKVSGEKKNKHKLGFDITKAELAYLVEFQRVTT